MCGQLKFEVAYVHIIRFIKIGLKRGGSGSGNKKEKAVWVQMKPKNPTETS
jgi:hypothetical protein